VTAEQPGPPLWKITNGENTLWLFAELVMVPEDLRWDSSRVARILSEADAFLSAPLLKDNTGWKRLLGFGMEDLNDGVTEMEQIGQGRTLDNIIDPEFYQKLRGTVPPDYMNQLVQYKPWFVGARLHYYWMKHEGFADSSKVTKELERLRRKYHVPKVESAVDVELHEMEAHVQQQLPLSDDYGIACLQSMLVFHENMDEVKSRLSDWFQGELSTTLLPLWGRTCNEAPWQIQKAEEVGKLWITNLQLALENNKVSFAVVPARALMGGNDFGMFPSWMEDQDFDIMFKNWLEDQGFDMRQPTYDN
jgi:hypothetical protein